MSRRTKALARFLSKPADFTYDEMIGLLKGFGYKEIKTGRSSGSRVAFVHPESGHIIRLHRPHPEHILKRYQLDFLEETLKAKGLLK
jgi:predicted RNA binding protein YcfA (HicA-like mRNA interferase family)